MSDNTLTIVPQQASLTSDTTVKQPAAIAPSPATNLSSERSAAIAPSLLGEYYIIACVDEKWGLGRDDTIPWHCPADMRWFRKITSVAPEGKTNALIVGSRTAKIIGRNLPGRRTFIVGRDHHKTLHDAITEVRKCTDVFNVFCIGGAKLYQAALRNSAFSRVYLSHVEGSYDSDVFFDKEALECRYVRQKFTGGEEYLGVKTALGEKTAVLTSIEYYEDVRGATADRLYCELVERTLREGKLRPNRTGVPSVSIFGAHFGPIPLTDAFGNIVVPMITSRRISFSVAYHELIWFLRGDTTTDYLKQNGVKIWNGNSSREYLDKVGLHDFAEGEVGASYGRSMRNFTTEPYTPIALRDANYVEPKGADQILNLEHTLRTDPFSRRLIVVNYNPLAICALPSCHVMWQMYVDVNDDGQKVLSSLITMRSCDEVLGAPINLTVYSLLTIMFALSTGMKPGTVAFSLGDAHVYHLHAAVKDQITRTSRSSPKLVVSDHIMNLAREQKLSVTSFRFEDLHVVEYYPHPMIHYEMMV